MKAVEMKEMSAVELNQKLTDLKSELFNLRFQHAINQLENPMRLKAVKKDIARVKILDARARDQEREPVKGKEGLSCEREKPQKNKGRHGRLR